MRITALVAIQLEVADELVGTYDPKDEGARLRQVVAEHTAPGVGVCTWCEEAESETYRNGDGHDDECPFAGQVTVPVFDVQWALPMVPVAVKGVAEDHDTAGIDTVATCSRCGGHDLRVEENAGATMSMLENYGHTVVFNSDSDYGDGDDLPGVVCAKCGAAIDFGDDVAVDYA